jgi:molybdopterin-containing oxidoreductase family iron-sulfur binding subunit
MSTETGSAGVKRRDFLKIVGASGAATAVVGCSSEKVGKLIPYVVNPDQTVPQVSNYYATTCRECAHGCGVLAEVRDGRAFKLEGNPEHPYSRGALCSMGQAAVQGLYNPDRYRAPMLRENGALRPVTWGRALQVLSQRLGEVRSRGTAGSVAFLNQHENGSFPAFLDAWLAGFGMPAHYAVDADASLGVLAANRAAYGVAHPRFDFKAARLIVAVNAEFLDSNHVSEQLDWADARAQLENAPRMVYVGPRRSLTGLNADAWIPARAGTELAVLRALRGQLPIATAAQQTGVDAAALEQLAREVTAAGSAVLVVAGGHGANAQDVAAAAAELNRAAGAVGRTVRTDMAMPSYDRLASFADLRALAQRMNAGQVPLVFVRGVNPVYATPRALGFRAAFAKVPFKVSFSSYPDETTELCDLVLPDHHGLEAWGDADAGMGQIALQQPTMEPVFDTRQTADVLITLAKADPAAAARYPFADYRAWLMGRFPGGAAGWTAAAPRGVVAGTLPAVAGTAPARAATAPTAAPAIESTQGEFFLVVYPSPMLGDGRGANKPWLQEISDPVTKISWQSWIELHPTTAKRLGVSEGDHLTVRTAAGAVTAPAYPYIGIRPDTVAIATGRGHTAYGRYAKGVGVNALDVLPVAETAAGDLAMVSTRCAVAKADGHSDLVTTEGSARQHGRGIAQAVLVTELGGLRQNPIGSEDVGGVAPASGAGDASSSPRGDQAGETGGQTQGAPVPGGDHTTAEGHGNVSAEVLAAKGAGSGEIPGEAHTTFLPGLRSPVANDAQGLYGDPTSKDKGMYDINHPSGAAKRRWAMTIDLARCTGCSACVTACYAENNLPTVGAPWQGRALAPGVWDERPGANIIKGREMTWIRLERYYEGAENSGNEFQPDFDTRFAPMLCQHCGNAPCEPVCPVYATYHSPDGLNVQVYNRCVGTRYCSNNCPYKVRYFNWFGYGEPDRRQYAWPEPMHWQLNPDVTVRGKGVMEKCTFCVQRIREAENRARLEGREVQPDEFTVACAQACPSRAITFGDAADPNWTVAQLAYDRRAYHVFEELNTFTAVVYLKKVNHPALGAPATA